MRKLKNKKTIYVRMNSNSNLRKYVEELTMKSSAIIINDLEFKYNKSKENVLDIENLSINSDKLIGLIGANGSGKTTMMKIIGGLIAPQKGVVKVLSGDRMRDDNVKRQIIYSMNDNAVEHKETVEKLVRDYNLVYPDFDREFANKIFDLLEIDTKNKISKLSTGNKSAVHFTCALATRAKITLLDEPFTGIDIAKRKTLYDILLRDYIEYPRTIVVSSHNLDEMENVLSEILLINDGKVVFYEDIDDVRQMYFRADGDVEKYKDNENVVKIAGRNMGRYIIAKGGTMCQMAQDMKKEGLKISSVSPCDVCAYLTDSVDEDKVEKLWESKDSI